MTHDDLRQAGHDVDAATYTRLARFVELLLAENRSVNLTGARDAATLWGHVYDSLALRPRVRAAGSESVLDLGSGGGIPGLPLACVCKTAYFTLLDATRKKIAALERLIVGLELKRVSAVCGRAEELAHEADRREQYDLVTARAVAELPILIEYAAGFVRLGGECWFFKTPAALKNEFPRAVTAVQTCGLEPVDTLRYRLPADTGERVLIGYRKRQPLPDSLPRRPGRATKRPL